MFYCGSNIVSCDLKVFLVFILFKLKKKLSNISRIRVVVLNEIDLESIHFLLVERIQI